MHYSKLSILIITLLLGVLLFSEMAFAQYQVSGLVEFSYRDYETKIGNSRSSAQYFTQTYRANYTNYIFDPRFLHLSAGVGYNMIKGNGGFENNTLDYDLMASFFPGQKLGGSAYWRTATNTIQSSSNIAGYDINSTSYGANLNARLSQLSRGNGRGNSNNDGNDNAYRGGSRFPLPDITLSYGHTESESFNLAYPIKETRDNMTTGLIFRPSNKSYLTLDGTLEEYNNELTGAGYDTKTAKLDSSVRTSPEGEIKIYGRVNDRTTRGYAGFTGTDRGSNLGISYNYIKSRVEQSYNYEYLARESWLAWNVTNKAAAKVSYRMLPELNVFGGLDYMVSEYKAFDPITGAVTNDYQQESGGFVGGISFVKVYRPDFLGPFAFNTNYTLGTGFTSVTSKSANDVSGAGRYYSNYLQLGLTSVDWQKENAFLTYSVYSKRDHSPAENDVLEQNGRLGLSSIRIQRTRIWANASYSLSQSSSAFSNIFSGTMANTTQQRRALIYDAAIENTPVYYLQLVAGASRSDISSTLYYTLSTLSPPSTASTLEDVFYAKALGSYNFTRNLQGRAELREEYRKTNASTGDVRTHLANMNLDYRIRMIICSLEYRFREDVPEIGYTTIQQYYFLKISRPF